MRIVLKEQYRGYKIGGGKSKIIHLEDLNQKQMFDLYNNGYSEFFDVIKEEKVFIPKSVGNKSKFKERLEEEIEKLKDIENDQD